MGEPVGGADESVTIEPPASGWGSLLASRSTRPLVIMTGHQAEFWHPGILAKYLAADAATRALRAEGREASAVWLVPDQDSNDPATIRYPKVTAEGPRRAEWVIPGAAGATLSEVGDTPTASRSPLAPSSDLGRLTSDLTPALPSVTEGIGRIVRSLHAHKDERSAARQITSALCDLLAPDLRPAKIVYASELYECGVFSELLERMRSNPAACTRAYNEVVAQHPSAHLRPLIDQPGRVELPLWRMPDQQGRPRRPVFGVDLPDSEPSQLAPRALLLTAVVRLEMCDLFIHGTGGGMYDRVTDAWLSRWLPGRALAPTAVVTSTRFLPFTDRPPPPEEITRARWRAHHARHDPEALGDEAAAHRKRQLLMDLRTARARGQSPSVAFKELHALLDTVRTSRAPQLQSLEQQASRALGQRELASVVYERTWPFPLYPEDTLHGLKAEIDAAFGLAPSNP